MKYRYMAVQDIPDKLDSGIVYHNKEFEIAALLCPCGCGHRISLLVPDSHQIYSEKGFVTIKPSISVCDATCKSHFFITTGNVRWFPSFSESEANQIMRDQIIRHASLDITNTSWLGRIKNSLLKILRNINAFFH